MSNSASSTDVTVIGAGVIGLSTALRLAEIGHRVRVVTETITPRTTSDKAAAFWYPYHVGGDVRVHATWACETYYRLRTLVGNPDCGVDFIEGREYFESQEAMERWRESCPWFDNIPEIAGRELPHDEVPRVRSFTRGVAFEIPVVRMPNYMAYLMDRLDKAAVTVERRTVRSEDIADLLDGSEYVVNCAGLGARDLVNDDDLYSGQGQVVQVAPLPLHHLTFITQGAEYEELPIYVVPRSGVDVILGGTYFENEESETPSDDVTDDIVRRCSSVCPELQRALIVDAWVGLRPCRDPVRVEPDLNYSNRLIHNYGHGGGGVTLSWGCAGEVSRLIRDHHQ